MSGPTTRMSDGHNSDVGFSTTSKSNVEQLECHLHSFPTIWTSKDSAGRSLGKVGWLSLRARQGWQLIVILLRQFVFPRFLVVSTTIGKQAYFSYFFTIDPFLWICFLSKLCLFLPVKIMWVFPHLTNVIRWARVNLVKLPVYLERQNLELFFANWNLLQE